MDPKHVPTVTLEVPCAPKDPKFTKRASNKVITSKYTFVNFLPRCLLLQFRRFTNAFFLAIALVMMASEFTGGRLFVSPYISTGTLMLLGVVVSFTVLTEAKDDIKRHRDDWKTNSQDVKRLRSIRTAQGEKPVVSSWGELRPGDVIRINNRDEVPADVLLLMSTNPNGRCYIETSGIDGETNLKIKEVPKSIRKLIEAQSDDWRKAIQGTFTYEQPNAFLQFNGVFEPKDPAHPKAAVDLGGVVLRGSELRNTEYVIAMVVYAGPETKLVMSKKNTPTKFSLMNQAVNKLMLVTMLFYVILVSGLAILILTVVEDTGEWNYFKFSSSVDAFILPGFLAYFLTFAVLFSNLVPINVVVSQEVANLVQAAFIRTDIKMYDEESDTHADARNSSLMAEVGQITHIFSDKTGTLTRNVMRLVGCSVGGCMYGHVPRGDDHSQSENSDEGSTRKLEVRALMKAAVQRSKSKADIRAKSRARFRQAGANLLWNSNNSSSTNSANSKSGSRPKLSVSTRASNGEEKDHGFIPSPQSTVIPQQGARHKSIEELFSDMLEAMKANSATNEKVGRFLLILALCHTVVIDHDENGDIRYNAEGPDEEALVVAAAKLGYVLKSTDNGTTTIEFPDGTRKAYQLMAVNTFSSARKRMSVVVQDESGKYLVLMKGADNVILKLLSKNVRRQDQVVLTHQLNAFAKGGLRTLIMVQRELDARFFEGWKLRYENALTSPMSERHDQLAKVAAEVERDCELVGASAIEDELQDGVPETITKIRNAGITLWVLTGDKLQTAVNIALTAKLLDSSMMQLKLESSDPAILEREIDRMQDLILIAASRQQKLHVDAQGSFKQRLDASKKKLMDNPKRIDKDGNIVITIHDEESSDPGSGDGDEDDENDELDIKKLRLAKSKAAGLPYVAEGLALVITGEALEHLITSQKGHANLEKKFLSLLRACKVVLACRVSPVQKALIVRLVVNAKREKNEPVPVSLAIGDGANDVPMIQEARVGVGISGKEGLQAVNSSDFSIAQFRFLQRLLFVHGRWNYRRNAFVIKFTTYAWQVLAYLILFFLFDSLVSGQQIFYNTYYVTFFPWLVTSFICAITWFDQDISDESALNLPYTYVVGRLNHDMNLKQLVRTCMQALIHGAIVYATIVLTADELVDLSTIGIASFVVTVFQMMAMQLFQMHTWNWVLFVLLGVWVIIFGATMFVSDILLGYDYQVLVLGDAAWFTWSRVPLATAAVFMLEFAIYHLWKAFKPSNMDIIMEMDRGYFKGKIRLDDNMDAVLDQVADSTKRLVFGPNLIQSNILRRAMRRARGDSEVDGLSLVDPRTSFDFSAPEGLGNGATVDVNRLSKRMSVRRSVVALGDVDEENEDQVNPHVAIRDVPSAPSI